MIGWVLIALLATLFYGLANILVAIMRPPKSHSLPLAAVSYTHLTLPTIYSV